MQIKMKTDPSDNETQAAVDALMIIDENRTGQGLSVCLLSYNQVQIPLPELCLQQNFSLIKRFRDCMSSLYPLPLKTMFLPNSVTPASNTHHQYNWSNNERAKAANWNGNNISNPATLAARYAQLAADECTDPHAQCTPKQRNGHYRLPVLSAQSIFQYSPLLMPLGVCSDLSALCCHL